MARIIYIFNGGNYKVLSDDGRQRVPLSHPEAEALFLDPELLSVTGTSHGAEFNMDEYADLFCKLEADDEIIIGVLPDSAMYRGIWGHMYNSVKGFVLEASLVSIKAVYDAHLAGDATGVANFPGTDAIKLDFTDGVNNATCDALDLAGMWEKDVDKYTNYRNNKGQVATPFDPVYAGLGQALYIRVKVLEIGDLGKAGGCNCGSNYPTFKVGAILDDLCADKQRVLNADCGTASPCKTGCCPDA